MKRHYFTLILTVLLATSISAEDKLEDRYAATVVVWKNKHPVASYGRDWSKILNSKAPERADQSALKLIILGRAAIGSLIERVPSTHNYVELKARNLFYRDSYIRGVIKSGTSN
jgi:hypothetical protein